MRGMASIADHWLPELSREIRMRVQYCVMQKKDILADCLRFAFTGVFKCALTVCLEYHSCMRLCLTQRLGLHKYAESVMYLLPYNIVIICIIVRARLDVAWSRKHFVVIAGSMHFITMNRQTIYVTVYGKTRHMGSARYSRTLCAFLVAQVEIC